MDGKTSHERNPTLGEVLALQKAKEKFNTIDSPLDAVEAMPAIRNHCRRSLNTAQFTTATIEALIDWLAVSRGLTVSQARAARASEVIPLLRLPLGEVGPRDAIGEAQGGAAAGDWDAPPGPPGDPRRQVPGVCAD